MLKLDEVEFLLKENFAPWIIQLGLKPKSITDDGMVLTLPGNPDLARAGGVVCGQAIASAADTCGVLALFAHGEKPRPLTTVDMTTHFLRPLATGDIKINATILSNGKRFASVRLDFRTPGKEKISATTTCAYAYLD